jgi:hypothetical protein
VAFASSEDLLSDFVLLALSFCKHNNLHFCIIRSGGRSHAHGMASKLPCSLRYKTKPDPVLEGSAPNSTPLRRRLHDLLLRPDECYLHPVGSASWCTRYGSVRKRTYSNQPIFLFPKQNGRRFD